MCWKSFGGGAVTMLVFMMLISVAYWGGVKDMVKVTEAKTDDTKAEEIDVPVLTQTAT